MTEQSKIKITDEMRKALKDASFVGDIDIATQERNEEEKEDALLKIVAIIERDYTLIRTTIPADVNKVTDRDGDDWYRLADSRWGLLGNGAICDSDARLQKTYGPVTW